MRRVYRLSALIILLFWIAGCSPAEGRLHTSMTHYPADGISTGTVELSTPLFGTPDRIIPPDPSDSIEILARTFHGNTERILFRSTAVPGSVLFRTESGTNLRIYFYASQADLDGDGFPDRAELVDEADRMAFRRWFVRIAESQYLKMSHSWNPGEHDCSGLIRLAYREALKRHDAEWSRSTGIYLDKNLPDIARFHYPSIPVIGEKLFRTAEGFSNYASAKNLQQYNTRYRGRELSLARPGDLLFFRSDHTGRFTHHSMIVVKNSGGKVFLLYHTGSREQIKRVPAEYLDQSEIYRPVAWNPNFLGVYSFHILE